MDIKASLLLIFCWISGISSYAEYSSSVFRAVRSKAPLDVSGAHAYRAPRSTDKRGPCPGLNALANNGYLNRSGIATPSQTFDASIKIGLAKDLAGLFASFAVLAGTGQVYSIGQGSSATGPGLDKHNFLEGDGSYTRCDCNECGKKKTCGGYTFKSKVWKTTYNAAQANGGLFGIPAFKIAAKERYDQCRANNSKCFFGPVQFTFHYGTPCLMAEIFPNDSDGLPTEAILNTWIGIAKDANGVLSGIKGGERIPDNWYPRAKPYTAVELVSCMRKLYKANPVEFGANIDGSFVAAKVQLPHNPTKKDIACFLYQTIASSTPAEFASQVGKYVNQTFLGKPWHCKPYENSG